MPRLGSIRKSAAVGLAAVTLTSCGIRLPDAPALTWRENVSKPPAAPVARDPAVLIWMVADELHTGVVFPYDWLLESGFIPPAGFCTPKYVTLSWGNRTAYVEKGLHSPWKFVRAMFMPSPSVMELIPANWNVTEVCPHQRIWRKLVARERGKDLAAFLNDCSTHGLDGSPIVCGTSSWGGGVLLESRHTYFVPRVCNIWTVQVIESLGGHMHPWLGITAGGVIRQAEKPANGFEKVWSAYAPEVEPNAATR